MFLPLFFIYLPTIILLYLISPAPAQPPPPHNTKPVHLLSSDEYEAPSLPAYLHTMSYYRMLQQLPQNQYSDIRSTVHMDSLHHCSNMDRSVSSQGSTRCLAPCINPLPTSDTTASFR